MKIGVLLGLLIFLIDRLVKILILNNFALGEVRSFLPGLLQLTYARNTGMAFGFLGGHQWIPLVLTPLILVGLGILLVKKMFPCQICRLALVAVMAGGLGNWVDRIAYGYVVDMFEFTFIRFAVFNVADIFITVGGIVFLVAYFSSEMRAMKAKGTEQTEEVEEQEKQEGQEQEEQAESSSE